MHHYVEDLIKQGLLDTYLKLGGDDLRHRINKTTQHPAPNNNVPRVINLFALEKPPTKEPQRTRKQKVMMINAVTKIDYNPVVAPQSTVGCFLSFSPKDIEKVHMPHADDLIIMLSIASCILKRILIDMIVDVSQLYAKAFREMRLLPSMLTQPPSIVKSFLEDLSFTLGSIRLPNKIGNVGNE